MPLIGGGYLGSVPGAAQSVGSKGSLSGSVASGAVTGQGGAGYFCIASGSLGRFDFNSGTVIDYIACEQAMSGIVAVAWGSGGCFVVPADRSSGLRLPVIGVVAGNFVSGNVVPVVRRGIVTSASSGVIASGFPGQFLFIGSGGLIINQSGFMGGASSGQGAGPTAALSGYSGSLVQRVGVSVSGGIDVFPGTNITSGLLSGLLAAY